MNHCVKPLKSSAPSTPVHALDKIKTGNNGNIWSSGKYPGSRYFRKKNHLPPPVQRHHALNKIHCFGAWPLTPTHGSQNSGFIFYILILQPSSNEQARFVCKMLQGLLTFLFVNMGFSTNLLFDVVWNVRERQGTSLGII